MLESLKNWEAPSTLKPQNFTIGGLTYRWL